MQRTLGASPFHPAPHVAPSQRFQEDDLIVPTIPHIVLVSQLYLGSGLCPIFGFPFLLLKDIAECPVLFALKGWARIRDRLRRRRQNLIEG